MVAVITGQGAGVERGSSQVLGAKGQIGSSQTLWQIDAFVNAANGNLILQSKDQSLLDLGPDENLTVTYNSQGVVGVNGWLDNFQRSVRALTGTANTSGSTITRLAADGTNTVYTYNVSKGLYVGNENGGSFDTLSFSASAKTWTWTDGASGLVETYDVANSGRLTSVKDAAGNLQSYTYAGSLLTQITNADGEQTLLTYSGSNLISVSQSTKSSASGALSTTTLVTYGYDASNRLTTISVYLSPQLGASGGSFTTTLGYSGASNLISSITDTSGASVALTYVQASGASAVSTIAQTTASGVTQTTTFSYNSASNTTVVTDPTGAQSALTYNNAGQLIRLVAPAASGTQGGGLQTTVFAYDANGNLLYSGPELDAQFTSGGQNWGQIRTSSVPVAKSVEVDGGVNVLRFVTNSAPAAGFTLQVGQTSSATSQVAVSAGQILQASAYVSSSGASSVALGVSFYDANGVYLSSATLSNIATGGAFGSNGVASAQFGAGSATAPQGAVTAALYVSATANGTAPLNLAIARPVLRPAWGANAIFDPNFSNLSLYWPDLAKSSTSIATTQKTEIDGGVSVYRRQTTTAPTAGFTMNLGQGGGGATLTPVSAGQYVNASLYASSSGASKVQLNVNWYDANGNFLSSSAVNTLATGGSFGAGGVGAAIRGGGAVVAPAGAAFAAVTITATASGVGVLNVAIAQPTVQITATPNAQLAPFTVGPVSAAQFTAPSTTVPSYAYAYDANGNLTHQIDSLGDTTDYAYDASNNLIAKTVYTTPSSISGSSWTAPANAETTYFVYDSFRNLTYVVSPLGEVTQNIYSASGQRLSTIVYTAQTYVLSGASASSPPSKAQLDAFVAGITNKTGSTRTDYVYDYRGLLASQTAYANVLSSGSGDTASVVSTTTYVYDPSGRLLQKVAPGATSAEQYSYDGLGRLLTSTDSNGKLTSISYNNASRTQTTTLANGQTDTKVFDLAARLISESVSGGGVTTATTTYAYDGAGNLLMSADPDGLKTFFFYDADGRKVAQVAPNGAVTRYFYTANNQPTRTIEYATVLTLAQLAALISGGVPANPALSTITPASNANDRITYAIYDTAGRLIETIDPAGAVTTYAYDGASELLSTTRYANKLSAATLTGLAGAAPTSIVLPTTSVGNDRTTRHFYDADGRKVGQLDAAGYLSQVVYDGAGRVTQTIAYAKQAAASYSASGTFSQLLASVGTTSDDVHTWNLYDSRGNLLDAIDGEGRLTRYQYNGLGLVSQKIQGQVLSVSTLVSTPPTLATLPAAGVGTVLDTTNYTYDVYGHVLTSTLVLAGSINETTTYTYDSAYNLISQSTNSKSGPGGAADPRAKTFAYDVAGHLTGSLGGVGSAALAALGASATAAQIASVYAAYGETYAYDAAGRMTSATNANGQKTLYAYNAAGQLAYQIDPAGDVTEYKYDAFGDRTDVIVHVTPLSSTTLSAIAGGVDATGAVATAVAGIAAANDYHPHTDYTVQGLTADEIDSLGQMTKYDYDAFEERTSIVAPTGPTTFVTTAYSYDLVGNLKTRTDDAGGLNIITSYGYDAFGNATSTTDGTGAVTRLTYNHDRQALTQTDALSNVTSYTYDGFGNLASVTDPAGIKTTYSADAFARNVTTTDALAHSSKTTYNAYGQVVKSTDALGNASSQTYDADGNRTSITDALTRKTTYTYNGADQLVSLTDALGAKTLYIYDAAGRIAYQIDPLGYVTSYAYDGAGRLISTTAFSNAITNSSLGANPTTAKVASLLKANTAKDETTRRIYDAAGRLIYQFDAANDLIAYTYDAQSRLLLTSFYGQIGAPSAFTAAAVVALIGGNAAISNAQSVYDALGRVIYTIDPTGAVVNFTYDADGRVVKVDAFATLFTALGVQTAAQMAAWASANATVNDRITRTYYDAAGRAVYKVDGRGYVTERQYDGAGKLTKTLQYAEPYTTSDTTTTASLRASIAASAVLANAAVSTNGYDAAGRLTSTTDPLGVVTQLVLKANGWIQSSTVAYGQADAETTAYTYFADGSVQQVVKGSGSSTTSTTNYTYDKDNRILTSTNAETGGSTSDSYDLDGRRKSRTVALTSSKSATTAFTYDAFGNKTSETDPLGRVAYFYYDQLNRLNLEIDPSGFATKTTYSAINDKIASVTRYAKATTGAAIGAPPPITPSTSDATSASDATTSFTYDNDGRLKMSTDANGAVTKYDYDAFGDQKQVTNALGAITSSTFNTVGEMDSQTKQMVIDGVLTLSNVKSTFEYDARGNLTKEVDALGLAEQRTTSHEYYLDNHLKSTSTSTFTATTVGASGAALSSATVTPKTTYTYDHLGNQTQKTDAAGLKTFSYYNSLNQKKAEVGPDGALTVYQYDALGRMTDKQAYGDLLAVSTLTVGGAAPAPINAANVRETQYRYDNNGRLITTTVIAPFVTNGVKNADGTVSVSVTANTAITVSNTYDDNGNLVQVTDARGNSTYNFYNALGQKIATVDPLNFLTAFTYDANGDVQSETAYATALLQAPTIGVTPTAPASNASDRITTYVYDKVGNRLSETRAKVASTVAAATANATITYTYDALGDITSKTQATGDKTNYTYSSVGQLLWITSPFYTDYQGNADVPITSYVYDAFGDVLSSSVGGTVNGVTQTAHVTTNVFNGAGLLINSTDASGFVTAYFYDADGRQVAKVYNRVSASGAVETDAVFNSYNALGLQTSTVSATLGTALSSNWTSAAPPSGAWTLGVSTDTYYDAFGEVIAKGQGTGGAIANAAERFVYDSLGRVWLTNTGNGAWKAYGYDENSNATVLWQSLGGTSLGGYAALGDVIAAINGGAGVSETISFYDARNKVTDVYQPPATDIATSINVSSSSTSTSGVQYYDASAWASNSVGTDQGLPGAATGAATITGGAAGTISFSADHYIDVEDYLAPINYNTSTRMSVGGYPKSYRVQDLEIDISPAAIDGLGLIHVMVTDSGGTREIGTINPTITESFGVSSYLPISDPNSRPYFKSNKSVSILLMQDVSAGVQASLGTATLNFVNGEASSTYGTPAVVNLTNLPTNASRVLAFVRPSGSSGPFTSVPASPLSNGMGGTINGGYSLNAGGPPFNGLPANTAYDLKYYALDGAGNIVAAQEETVSVDGSGAVSASNAQPLRINGAGDVLVDSWNNLVFFGQPANGGAVLNYSNGGGYTPVYASDNSGYGPGVYVYSLNGLSGSYDYWLDVNGGQTRLNGQFTAGGGAVINGQYGAPSAGLTLNAPSGQYATSAILSWNGPSAGSLSFGQGASWWIDARQILPWWWDLYNTSGPYNFELLTYNGSTLLSDTTFSATLGYSGGGVTIISQAQSVPAEVQIVPPAVIGGPPASLSFGYRHSGTTGAFTPVILTPDASGRFFWNVDSLRGSPDTYEFVYTALDASGQPLTSTNGQPLQTGQVYIGSDQYSVTTNTQTTWTLSQSDGAQYLVHRAQGYDAFGDITSETDGRGATTTLVYNTEGELIQKVAPIVNAVSANGVGAWVTPTDTYAYDLSGRMIAHTDANGMTTAMTLQAGTGYDGGQATVLATYTPDGAMTSQGVDLYGFVRTKTDGLGAVTTDAYDAMGRLIEVDHPIRSANDLTPNVQLKDYYAYDGLGERISHTNNQLTGQAETTAYDNYGRITTTTTFTGALTSYGYGFVQAGQNMPTIGLGNFGGWQTSTTNSAGKTSYSNHDYFGNLEWSQDFSGRIINYSYNAAAQLVWQGNPVSYDNKQQNITYAYYANGYVKSITDNGIGRLSEFAYDNNGNRTLETYINTSGGASYALQNASATYDALNRLTSVTTPGAAITYTYDAVGNRREMTSTYNDLVTGASQRQDYWYAYDALNRFTVTMGTLNGNNQIVAGATGVQITYDAASNRRSAFYGNDGHTEYYGYSADGYLETTDNQVAGASNAVRVAQRRYDAMGDMTFYQQWTSTGAIQLTRAIQYDGMYRITGETDDDYTQGPVAETRITNAYAYGGADQGVLMTSTRTTGSTTAIYTYAYTWWDTALQSSITVQGTNPSNPNAVNWAQGYSNLSYDANGHLLTAVDVSGGHTLNYLTDSYGHVLVRQQMNGQALGEEATFLFFDGRQIGDQSNTGPDQVLEDYGQALAAASAGSQSAGHRAFKPVSAADFDQSYQPIDPGYPAASGTQYTVQGGDTLSGLAKSFYGDASLWWIIADANGLSANATLTAGQLLVIPNKVANLHNTYATTRPYNAGQAIGDVLPTLPPEPLPPPPPQQDDGGCGGIGAILEVVVAVAVTYLTQGLASGLLDSAVSSSSLSSAAADAFLESSAAGAITGAAAAVAGDVAAQTFGLATGIQSKFNWAEVGTSFVAGGVGGAVQSAPVDLGDGVLNAVEKGAVSSVIAQGADTALGLQHSFSWTNVAVAGIMAGAGREASSLLKDAPTDWRAGAANVIGAVAGAGIKSAIEGSDFAQNLQQLLPQAVGQTIGELVAGAVQRQPTAVVDTSAYNAEIDPRQTIDGSADLNGVPQVSDATGVAGGGATDAATGFGSISTGGGASPNTGGASDGLTAPHGQFSFDPSVNGAVVDLSGPAFKDGAVGKLNIVPAAPSPDTNTDQVVVNARSPSALQDIVNGTGDLLKGRFSDAFTEFGRAPGAFLRYLTTNPAGTADMQARFGGYDPGTVAQYARFQAQQQNFKAELNKSSIKPRLPDYVAANITLPLGAVIGIPQLGVSLNIAADRYGHDYLGIGPALGGPAAFGGSLTGNWLVGGPNDSKKWDVYFTKTPSEVELSSHITEWGISSQYGNYALVGGAGVNLSGASFKAGIGTPGTGIDATWTIDITKSANENSIVTPKWTN